jgi:hypothetical protein
MTLQNLGKILDKYESQLGSTDTEQFIHLKGLPFYHWRQKITNYSKLPVTGSYHNGKSDIVSYLPTLGTFNHAIGLPQKNVIAMPLFDYEQLLFDTLQSNKHLWIKKATGLGVTEFMLRYMAWLCFADKYCKFLSGSQMCIVTDPRIELAITLIDRMKSLFRQGNFGFETPKFDTKETVIELNGVHIEAYPSHHLDAMRGLKDVSFIYLDEADFFPPGQQQDARDVSERYTQKVIRI